MASDSDVKYLHLLGDLKQKIQQRQLRAIVSVNQQLLFAYWEIGAAVLKQQKEEGWGTKIIDRLSADLKLEFPEMKGLSSRNIKYMRAFAEAYPDFLIVQPVLAQIQTADNQQTEIMQVPLAQLSWYHHITLLDKVKEPETRNFYIQHAVKNGWSRNVLVHQIESGLHKRQGALTHNFKETLPSYQSDLTQQLFKDPYQLDFIMLGEAAKERDLEDAMMTHITKLLLELGDGFAFMGRQKKFEAGGKEFFIDLLFYNTKLRRHIIIELKIGEFEPEFVSKMNVYLGLADDNLKGEFDQPAIGLILCKTKNKIVAEYALRDTSKPIGIAEYKIAEKLPEDIKGELPSIEEIEQKMDEKIEEHQNPAEAKVKAVRERLRNLKTDEIQTPATYKLLQDLFQNGLKPLYLQIINKMMSEFSEAFVSQIISWTLDRNIVHDIAKVEEFWKDENNLRSTSRLDFSYKLEGLRKSGTLSLNEYFSLLFLMDTFSYSFKIDKYDSEPIVKKLYHQPLTQTDIQLIIDTLTIKVADKIDWMIEEIGKK